MLVSGGDTPFGPSGRRPRLGRAAPGLAGRARAGGGALCVVRPALGHCTGGRSGELDKGGSVACGTRTHALMHGACGSVGPPGAPGAGSSCLSQGGAWHVPGRAWPFSETTTKQSELPGRKPAVPQCLRHAWHGSAMESLALCWRSIEWRGPASARLVAPCLTGAFAAPEHGANSSSGRCGQCQCGRSGSSWGDAREMPVCAALPQPAPRPLPGVRLTWLADNRFHGVARGCLAPASVAPGRLAPGRPRKPV